MAHWIDRSDAFPFYAGSAINRHTAVRHSASGGEGQVLPVSTSLGAAQEVIGVAVATAASPGVPVAVQMSGVAKMVAASTIAAGADVIVASSNGAVGAGFGAASPGTNRVGIADEPALAGETFSVIIRPARSAA